MINYFKPHAVKIGEDRYVIRRISLFSFIFCIPIAGWICFIFVYLITKSNVIFEYMTEHNFYFNYENSKTYTIEEVYSFLEEEKANRAMKKEREKKFKVKPLSDKELKKEYTIKTLQK